MAGDDRPWPTRVIVTADDFGLHESVNDAVEQGVRHGVLTSASLMVGAPAADDAVMRARALDGLAVGLHLVLTDGTAVLPPDEIPDLVDAQGRFHYGMAGAGARFFFRPRVRRQLAAEVQAQFAAFAATGLTLDHVNAHKHFHLHPTVADLMLRIGRDYGLATVRLPNESPAPRIAHADRRPLTQLAENTAVTMTCAALRRRLKRAGVAHNDYVVGIRHTGHMDEQTVLDAIAQLGPGVTEIYLHPARQNGLMPAMADYDHRGELAALLSPKVRNALDERGLRPTHFGALATH